MAEILGTKRRAPTWKENSPEYQEFCRLFEKKKKPMTLTTIRKRQRQRQQRQRQQHSVMKRTWIGGLTNFGSY